MSVLTSTADVVSPAYQTNRASLLQHHRRGSGVVNGDGCAADEQGAIRLGRQIAGRLNWRKAGQPSAQQVDVGPVLAVVTDAPTAVEPEPEVGRP